MPLSLLFDLRGPSAVSAARHGAGEKLFNPEHVSVSAVGGEGGFGGRRPAGRQAGKQPQFRIHIIIKPNPPRTQNSSDFGVWTAPLAQKTFPKGVAKPPTFWNGLWGPGAVQTSKIDDFCALGF